MSVRTSPDASYTTHLLAPVTATTSRFSCGAFDVEASIASRSNAVTCCMDDFCCRASRSRGPLRSWSSPLVGRPRRHTWPVRCWMLETIGSESASGPRLRRVSRAVDGGPSARTILALTSQFSRRESDLDRLPRQGRITFNHILAAARQTARACSSARSDVSASQISAGCRVMHSRRSARKSSSRA